MFGILLHPFMNKMDSSSTLEEDPCTPFFPLLASLYISLHCYSKKKKKVLVGSGLTELGQNLGLATQLKRFYLTNKVLQSHWAGAQGA